MQDDNCIFCKLAKGEIPTNKLYEDDVCIAFRDMEPLMPTHVLIIPKEIMHDVIERALEKASTEKTMRKAVEGGMPVTEAFAKFGVL